MLFDQQDDVAQRGSGIEAGLIAPELGLNSSSMNRFYNRAYRMALSSIEDGEIRWNSRGVIEFFQKDEARRRVQHMQDGASLWNGAAQLMSPSESSSQIGIKVSSHGIWFNCDIMKPSIAVISFFPIVTREREIQSSPKT